MTHALSAAVDQVLARARYQVAEHASDMEMWLTTHDRDQVVIANALQLTQDYASDPLQLAYIAAEAIAQTVPPVAGRRMKLSEAGTEAAFFGLRRELWDPEVVARFTIDGEPMSKARARWARGGTQRYSPKANRDAENVVAGKFRRASGSAAADADHSFGVVALFFGATCQRRDVDNMLKLILDGLNGVAWADDSQVIEASGRKDLVSEMDEARTEVVVYSLGPALRFTRKCEQCGTDYPSYRSQQHVRRFCSQVCHLAFRRAARVRTCSQCSARFDSKSSTQVYCSADCKRAGHTVELACIECEAKFVKPVSQARGVAACSPACRAAYWRKHRAANAKGTCEACGGPTSKKSYVRCRPCMTGRLLITDVGAAS